MKTQTLECLRCNGTGKLAAFSHIAKGRCFLCGGTGIMSSKALRKEGEVSASFQVFIHSDGAFHYAAFRVLHVCKAGIISTLTNEMVLSADEAREQWKAQRSKNVTLATIKYSALCAGHDEVKVFQEGASIQV